MLHFVNLNKHDEKVCESKLIQSAKSLNKTGYLLIPLILAYLTNKNYK